MKVNMKYEQIQMEIECNPEEFTKVLELINKKIVLTIKHEHSYQYIPNVQPTITPFKWYEVTSDDIKVTSGGTKNLF